MNNNINSINTGDNPEILNKFTGDSEDGAQRGFLRVLASNIKNSPYWQNPQAVKAAIDTVESSLEDEEEIEDQENFFSVYLDENHGVIPAILEVIKKEENAFHGLSRDERGPVLQRIKDLRAKAIDKQSESKEYNNTADGKPPEELLDSIRRMARMSGEEVDASFEDDTQESKERQQKVNPDFVDWATGKADFEGFTSFNDKHAFLDEMEEIWEHAHNSDESTLEVIRASFDVLIDSVERMQNMRDQWEKEIEPIGDVSRSFANNKDKTVTVETLFRELDLDEDEKQAVIESVRD